MRLVLEPRFMFDASVGAAGHHIRDSGYDSGQGGHPAAVEAALHVSADARPAAGDRAVGTAAADTDTWARTPAGGVAAQASVAVSAVLFVDPRVANWQTLANSVAPGTKVIVVDPTEDGLAQVSAAMGGLRDVQTVNFLTYGTAGQIELGSSVVNAATLMADAHEIAGWRDHMADNAQILLWGCDVGEGSGGTAFIDDLHALTGAGVAASSGAVGSAALGGGWTLDRTVGTVDPVVPFSAAAVADYQNVLDTPLPTVTVVTPPPAQVLLGATFTETVGFTNTAANAAGYGPIIEVFAPSNANETANLTSATYLGSPLTETSVTLSTSVAGHSGTLGALDPLIVDANGNPVFVKAPTGTVAGDTMYVIQLPFGSFTPGQPTADVVLNFSTTNTSLLSAQPNGQPVTIDAIGGFIYGADPLNNPATDLPIQGIAGNQGSMTAADGLVSASTDLVLATVSSAVVTPPGENETATGPDFVSHYLITVTPAPATSVNAITNLTTTITLPGNIEYTGGGISVSGSDGVAKFTGAPDTPGGTVTVTFASLSARDAASTTIDIPFFVPQYDASGNSILNPTTGAPVLVDSPVTIYENGTWDPLPGSADAGTTYDVAGSVTSDASFTAKSLAVQMTAEDLVTGSSTQTYPDDPVQYTVTFEVSDYFNMSHLSVQTLLMDGLVINPAFAPALTLTPGGGGASIHFSLGNITSYTDTTPNGQTVPTSGSNADWSFSYTSFASNQGAQTEVTLNTGGLVSGPLSGGETGSLVYQAAVLDKYTNTNINPSNSVLSSITEMDTVSSTTIGTAAVFTTAGVATGDTITDNSSNTLTVPTGTGRVGIVAIDGVGVTPGTEPEVTPGETVTYSITRTLSTGDYASLNLTAYLPLPVFDVADPLSNGGNVSSFTQAGTIGDATFLPAAGEYTYFVTSAGAGAPAYVVQSANVGTTANDITFSLGSRDDSTNAHNQTVTIYFTVTASSAPFADGLLLTAQGQTVLTNGSGTVATTENIGQIKVDEPNLVDSIKVGIASLVNNSGVAQSTGFTVDGVGTAADPTGYYAAAGTSGDLFVGAGNTGPGTTPIGGLQDLNVSGADASNTVRIVETIGNAGAAGAYDVVVSDLLPAGYTVSDVNLASLTVVQSGTLIQLVPQAGETLADLFTAGGVTLENPNSTSANPIPTLNATGQTGSVMTIAFDMTLHSNQSAGAVLIDTGNILNYTNIYNGVANNNGFVVDGNPVGGSKANLVDTATITTAAIVPTLYFTAEANGTTSVSPGDTANIAMTVGDIARLHGVAEIPSGTNSDVVLDFALPAGFVYTADNTLTLALVSPNGSFTSTTLDLSAAGLQVDSAAVANVVTYAPSYLAAADATVVNGHLQINLGTLSNNNGSDAPNYAIVEFNAQVANVAANTANQRLIDNFGVQANGSEIAANPLTETVVEPNVTLAKTVTVNPATDSATYVITLHNNSGITAYNVDVTDPYPAGNVLSVSTVAPGGLDPSLPVTPADGTNIFTATLTMPSGTTETFTYTLTVANPADPVPATTTSETWQDINPAVTGLNYNGLTSSIGTPGSATGSRDGSGMPNAGINDYWNQVTASLGTASGEVWQALGNTPGTYDSLIDTPLSDVSVTIAANGLTETVTTDATGSYFAGLIPNGNFTVTLPDSGALNLPANETLVVNTNGNLDQPGIGHARAVGTGLTGINFVYELPDTAPVLGNWASGKQTITPSTPAPLSTTGAATAVDLELDKLTGNEPATYSYNHTVLTLERYAGGTAAPNAADVFGGDSALTLSGTTVTLSGQTIGSFTESGGVLTVTFNANATAATVQEVLDHLTYSNATTGTLAVNLTIGATLSDANFSNVDLQGGATTGAQGTGGVMTSAPVFSVFTLLPQTNPYTDSFIEPNNTPAAGNAITLTPVNVADLIAPGATLSQVVITLGGAVLPAGDVEDVLSLLASGAIGNITGSYNATTRALTLTSAGNSATIGQWQAALGDIQYYDSSAQPYTTPRSVTYALTSATGGGTTTARLGTIDVSATDDSPILDPNAVLALPHSTEDALAPPTGAVGALVSTLANSSDITDSDGANAHDGSAPGPAGLAITAADTTVGNWWYSTNNGATWTEFAGSGLTPISATNALHLSADASTRIYFQPTVPDWNGEITPALTFRAWDQADGVANGTLSALPTDGAFGTGINLQASAYSAATVSVNLIDDPINDAPIASGSTTLPSEPEDTTVPPAETVTALFGPNFSDTADQQQTPANPTGSVANTLAGVAVIADPTPTYEGVWRYSTNGGATWTSISTSVSDTSALILPASALIDFLPVPDFNGAPLPLTERLIDNSTDVPITGNVTGLALQQGTTAYSGVDVSGAHNDGRTAVSAATVPLDELVTPINDAPIADGSATLDPVVATNQHPPGDTVANLYGPAFSDTADQQQTAINPTGSVANVLAGVVIVGNTAPAADGTWRYSTDGGSTWVTIGTNVSDSNGLVLGTSAKLAFFPNPSFHGSPPPLEARLIDNSSDLPLIGSLTGAELAGTATAVAGVDVSGTGNGGRSAVSADEVPLNVRVVAANNPIPKPPPFEPIEEITGDGGMPPGWLVGSMVYRTIIAEQSGVIGVSADAFYGSSTSEYLSYEATTASGGPLPPWMNFDPGTLTFSGVPPESAVGTLDLRVLARDRDGREATAEVHVIIMQDVDAAQALMHALSQRRIAFPFLHAAHPHAPDSGRHKAAPSAPRLHAGRSGFSAQVREQAASGRLGRARAMLAGLSGPSL